MMRPFTLICVVLAACAGLYLYETKQRTLLLDRRITEVLRQTSAARGRVALLRAEYADLGRPDRLLALTQKFLAVRPTAPSQFVEDAALDAHLPPIGPAPQDVPTEIEAQTTQMTQKQTPVLSLAAPAESGAKAVTAGPAARPQHAAAAAVHARPVLIASAQGRPRAATAQQGMAREMARAVPQPVLRRAPSLATLARAPVGRVADGGSMLGGSMLGGADAMDLPAPVPVSN